jgi:hypothetical protein
MPDAENPAAMRFNDGAGNRRPHSHAIRLSRVERMEQKMEIPRVDAEAIR